MIDAWSSVLYVSQSNRNFRSHFWWCFKNWKTGNSVNKLIISKICSIYTNDEKSNLLRIYSSVILKACLLFRNLLIPIETCLECSKSRYGLYHFIYLGLKRLSNKDLLYKQIIYCFCFCLQFHNFIYITGGKIF